MNSQLARRMETIEESATLAMAAKAEAYRLRGIDVINLSLGEPDFKTPAHICEAAKRAIDEGKYFAYPPVAGYMDLREAIARKYAVENHAPYKAENVVVSNGAKQAVANALLALLDPGDEVIILSPFWVSYEAIVRLAEAKPVIVKGALENGFKPTAQQIAKAITPKTRALIYSSPCNPTGSVLSKAELEAVSHLVLANDRIVAVADEIYEHINFSGERISMAALPGMMERTITINGFSKAYAMTGWRVGYLAAPLWIAKGSAKMQGQITSANCSIAQRAALAALISPLTETQRMTAEYKRRRDRVYALLSALNGIRANLPEGAFYFLFDVSSYYGRSDGSTVLKDGYDFCAYMLDVAHVSLVPGAPFGDENCVRLSCAASEDKLVEGLERIRCALERFS